MENKILEVLEMIGERVRIGLEKYSCDYFYLYFFSPDGTHHPKIPG